MQLSFVFLNYRNKKVGFIVSLFENVAKIQFIPTYPTNKIWHMMI